MLREIWGSQILVWCSGEISSRSLFTDKNFNQELQFIIVKYKINSKHKQTTLRKLISHSIPKSFQKQISQTLPKKQQNSRLSDRDKNDRKMIKMQSLETKKHPTKVVLSKMHSLRHSSKEISCRVFFNLHPKHSAKPQK